MQLATPGTYEHIALTYAVRELRRGLYPHLEEWEIGENEISFTGITLGEGGFATVHASKWLGGDAAVKVFRKHPVPGRQGTLSTSVSVTCCA